MGDYSTTAELCGLGDYSTTVALRGRGDYSTKAIKQGSMVWETTVLQQGCTPCDTTALEQYIFSPKWIPLGFKVPIQDMKTKNQKSTFDPLGAPF